MELFTGVSDPIGYGLAVVMFGGWIGLLWMVRLMFSGKLRSGREVEELIKQRDKWEDIALRALGVADRTTQSAEVLHDIAAVLPDPAKEGAP